MPVIPVFVIYYFFIAFFPRFFGIYEAARAA